MVRVKVPQEDFRKIDTFEKMEISGFEECKSLGPAKQDIKEMALAAKQDQRQRCEDKALKFDGRDEKRRWDLMPTKAVEGMLKVLEFGEIKYESWNWAKGFHWTRLIAAAYRHLTSIKEGEDIDPESVLPHVHHLMCMVAFLAEHWERGLGTDDRFKWEELECD